MAKTTAIEKRPADEVMAALAEMADPYRDLDEASTRMRVHGDTLLAAVRSGALKAKRTGKNGGGKYLFHVADLDAWFDGLVDA